MVKISSVCCSLFRRCGFALWGGTVWDGINSCGQKSNSWQFSSSSPPPPKLQITRGIPLTRAPTSSSAKSPDSPHNMVFTPECSHVSIDFLAKSLGHHDSELNYTLCTRFSHLNQQIMACVQLGISSWKGGTQAAPIGDQIQGCSFEGKSAGKGQARENKFIYCKWAQNT